MVLVLPKSRCAICSEPLHREPYVGFGPFVPNRNDPVHVFHDAAVHARCLASHPLASEVERYLSHRDDKFCVVCGELLGVAPAFFAGFLTSDKSDALYEFNYAVVHDAHFEVWNRATDFRLLLTEFVSRSGVTRGISFEPNPKWTTVVPTGIGRIWRPADFAKRREEAQRKK